MSHDWNPGEYARYLACPTHAGLLGRMDFDAALAIADDCADCVVEHRGDDQ